MKIFNVILIGLSFLLGIFLYPQLPNQIPMHWNVMGQIDGYMAKNIGVWLMPMIALVMYISFQILPNFDPNKKKYKLFQHEWEIMQVGLVGFFTYMQCIVLYLTLHPTVLMMPLMFIGLGTLFILMGNYMSKIRQNYFIGIKVPWTLADEDNWNKTHRFASWCFVGAGILMLIEAYVLWNAPVIIFGSILLAAILPILYSFLLYKKAVHIMKFIYIGLFVAIMLIAAVRMFSGEDDWICKNGQWIRHGNPSAPMLVESCK